MFGDLRRSRRVAYTAAFIGLITLGGWISVPFVPVPFTLQTFFVLLAAAVMKRDAVIPVALYVALGALGLPVFHNGIRRIWCPARADRRVPARFYPCCPARRYLV